MTTCGSSMDGHADETFIDYSIDTIGLPKTNLTGIDKYTPPAEDTSQPPGKWRGRTARGHGNCPDRFYAIQVSRLMKSAVSLRQSFFNIEWSMSDFVEYLTSRIVTAPVVGQFTDDNGDGVVDGNDTCYRLSYGQSIVCGSPNTDGPLTIIRLISGDGTGLYWTKQNWEWQGEWYEPIAAGTPASEMSIWMEPELSLPWHRLSIPRYLASQIGFRYRTLTASQSVWWLY